MSDDNSRSASSGAEQRQHFRVNTELRVSLQGGLSEVGRPWAHASAGGLSPLVNPPEEELQAAFDRLRSESPRQVNLSAGGFRTSFRRETEEGRIPHVETGERLSALLELACAEDPEFTLVHLPAEVVWKEVTMKWAHMGFQYVRVPTPVERILTQFVMEVERRRLRTS